MSTVGVDLGTSGVRAAAYDEQGQQIAVAVGKTSLQRPREGWIVVDAEAVLQSAESLLAAVVAAAADLGDPARAIALSSQGEAVVPVDRQGRALSLAPVSMDARGEPAARAMSERFGARRVQQITGQPLNRMFSVYKIAAGDAAWRPPAAIAYRALSDFISIRWGAAPAIDWTLAARTGLFDVETAAWSAEMTAAAAVDAPWLTEVPFSECVPSGTPIGTVSAETAKRLGLPGGTALVAGAHDQAASFIGAGGRVGSVSAFALGSSDCLTVETTQRPAGIAGTGFATYPWQHGRWLTLAGTAAGGWTLDWYVDLIGADADALLSESSTEPPPVIVLPYLAGSGTLDNDPTGRGAVVGLTLDLSRAELTRAFLEAAGYELGNIVDAFTAAGVPVGQVRAVGAGATNPITLGIRASAAGVPLTPAHGNASARGAALLAGAAIGLFDIDDLPSITLGATAHPDPNTVDWYVQQREAYRDLYRVLKPFNQRLEVQKGQSTHASPDARHDARRR
ncbi:MAG TPA: FGGY family carbohydrate kinase [Propionibacteriaceae bacterium]|nr:FGGY family carbohydrate kinase [Propionibacteriaceae bacterium]